MAEIVAEQIAKGLDYDTKEEVEQVAKADYGELFIRVDVKDNGWDVIIKG